MDASTFERPLLVVSEREVERKFFLGVLNPAEKPWIFRVEMDAVYHDPLFDQREEHHWAFTVPGDGGYFAAPPWSVPAIAIPDWTVVRYDGRVKVRGGPNYEVEALYSQSSFVTLSPLWRLASVGVVPDQVDWSTVAKVVVDLRNVEPVVSPGIPSTFTFQLLEVQGEVREPPARYFTYQVSAPATRGPWEADVTYHDIGGKSTQLPTITSSDPWLLLPPTAASALR